MKIKQNIEIEIDVKNKKPLQCGDCQFIDNEYSYFCHLFNIDLKEKSTFHNIRCQQCLDIFGVPE